MVSVAVPIRNANTLGMYLAHLHDQPLLPEVKNRTLMDGRHIYLKSRTIGMPKYKEIEDAVMKMDAIINQITVEAEQPFVTLWNRGKGKLGSPENPYGNPAWDLGIVVNELQDGDAVERFLRQYLDNGGVAVTIIELYVGVLYSMLSDAVANRNEMLWYQIAKRECIDIAERHELRLEVISADMLAHLGLPGLERV